MNLILKYQLFLILIVSFLGANAQENFNKSYTYSNEQNELFCLENDTFFLKIYNKDAFNTFSVGRGLVKSKNSKICIKKIMPIAKFGSTITKEVSNSNKIGITFLDKEGQPLKFSFVRIKNSESGQNYFEGNCDENGFLFIDNLTQVDMINSKVLVSLESLGLFTEKTLIWESGYNYTIISKINYNYNIINKRNKIKIKFLSSDRILIKINKLKTILQLNSKNIVKQKFGTLP